MAIGDLVVFEVAKAFLTDGGLAADESIKCARLHNTHTHLSTPTDSNYHADRNAHTGLRSVGPMAARHRIDLPTSCSYCNETKRWSSPHRRR